MKVSLEEIYELREECGGICRNCEARNYMIEPDARNYDCDECEKPEVFGIEELIQMGELEIE